MVFGSVSASEALGAAWGSPTGVPLSTGPEAIRVISTFGAHTMAIRMDGTLWGWGRNDVGQLGIGSNIPAIQNTPEQVETDNDWAYVSAGEFHTVAIRTDGTLWAWGSDSEGQSGLGGGGANTIPLQVGTYSDWASVAAGSDHTVAVKTDGSLWAWGRNDLGQLGIGSTVINYNTPQRVGLDYDWEFVTAGFTHSLGIKTNGELWAWGNNGSGQLGLGDNNQRNAPVQVGVFTDWESVSAGNGYTAAIRSGEGLYVWGDNNYGQLGIGNNTPRFAPVQVSPGYLWSSVSAGMNHTLAVRDDGTLWVWGYNSNGQLGLGNNISHNTPQPLRGIGWENVSAGGAHTVAIRSGGGIWIWGNNSSGQLGNGLTSNVSIPTPIFVPYAPFVPVDRIKNYPTSGTVNVALPLSAAVVPTGASLQVIEWSTSAPGAAIANNQITATVAGNAVVTATIVAGAGGGVDFTQNITINFTAPGGAVPVNWTGLTANGTSGSVTTTQLTLTFSAGPATLTANNITVTGATRGALAGSGNTRTLVISDITVEDGEDIRVSISNPAGFTINPSLRDVAVFVADTEPSFIEVVRIDDLPTTAVAGTTLTLTGTVYPPNATNRTIVWSIPPGTTGATITGDVLNAAVMGTITVRASVVNGLLSGLPFTYDFEITVTSDEDFVQVTNITLTSAATVQAGTPLVLAGAVVPSDATNTAISWSVVDVGTTGATITRSSPYTLNTTAAGTATIRASVLNGTPTGLAFTRDFDITVTEGAPPPNRNVGVTFTPDGAQYINVPLGGVVHLPMTVNVIVTDPSAFAAAETLSFQWLRDGSPVGTPNTARVVSAQVPASISRPNANPGDSGMYALRVSLGNTHIATSPGHRLTVQPFMPGPGPGPWAPGPGPTPTPAPAVTPAPAPAPTPVPVVGLPNEGEFFQGRIGFAFAPGAAVTRGELAQAIFNLHAGRITPPGTPVPFSDIAASQHGHAVNFVSAMGFMNGFPDGTFRPDEQLSRGEAAAVLSRIYGLSGFGVAQFTDTNNHWSFNYVALSADRSIINGYPDNTFRPNNPLSRAEATALLVRADGRNPMSHIQQQHFVDVPATHWAFNYIMSASVPRQ